MKPGSRLALAVALAALHAVLAARVAPQTRHIEQQAELRGCTNLPKSAHTGCVLDFGQGFEFYSEERDDCIAKGVYVDSRDTASNFGKLRIVTSGNYSDKDQMAAAGFLEGYLTAERIWDHHYNMHKYFVNQLNASLEKPIEWLYKQETWARQQVRRSSNSNAFWRAMDMVLSQFDGLVEGYKARAAENSNADAVGPLDRPELMFLNCNGDLYDVLDSFAAGYQPTFNADSVDPHQYYTKIALQGKCSALVKVTGDLSDLLMGHSTWDSYTAMMRIYKHYDFALADPAVVSRRMSFSSYPGELFSDDDFYLMDSGLVVLETTNHIYNEEILKSLSHASALSWQRVRAANMLTNSSEAWVDVFSHHNSGTYNNQYMVLDLKRFQPGQELQPGLMWVVEQLPGIIKAVDATETLSRGYWPSYNVPYFHEIYNASGYAARVADLERHGKEKFKHAANWLKYEVNPRAKIFRRDQGKIEDVESMKDMMRYNDWRNDKYAEGDPLVAVCGRGDLASKDAESRGCYDSKVTSYSMALKLESQVVNGPTTAHGQPPFSWDDERWSNLAHRGMPNSFDHKFERMSPSDLPLPSECSGKREQQ